MRENQIATIPQRNPITPLLLFLETAQNISQDAIYVCAPVTARRNLSSELTIEEVKRHNTLQVLLQLEEISAFIEAADQQFIVPGKTGTRHFSENLLWGEFEYNLFLMMVLLGIREKDANSFCESIQLPKPAYIKMNNYQLSPEEKRENYKTFGNQIIESARKLKHTSKRMLILDGINESLGCQMEIDVAQALTIPMLKVVRAEGQTLTWTPYEPKSER